MTIRLQGKKVVLRDLTERDVELIWHANHQAEDRAFQLWNGPYAPVKYVPFEEVRPRFDDDLALVGTDRPRETLVIEIDGEFKGTCSRYWVDPVTNWFEIGIVIVDSRYWSGGYGSDAFQMWIDYLFQHVDTVRLGIATWSGNERMMRLAAKCGMSLEARIRKARIVHGEYYDSIKMGILREEWQAHMMQRNQQEMGF